MALALGAWAVWFIDRPQGGLVLIRLSLLPAVVGGGFGPPLIGIIAGVTATRDRSHGWQKAGIYRMALARIWPWPIECRGGRLPVVGSGHGVGPLDRVRITSLPERSSYLTSLDWASNSSLPSGPGSNLISRPSRPQRTSQSDQAWLFDG